jgi:hypothetical protein
MTADEERPEGEEEENAVAEDQLLGGVVAVSLGELEAEREHVRRLVRLARHVYDVGEESKFERLREVIREPRFRRQKLLIFTEHRDTLDFLLRRLEGLGFAGQVAHIHGGMDWRERQAQVDHFRRPADEDGSTYMVCTDAAAEGINLQFCWVMVNYDIPWNPALLEQRMGRVHRYKQLHDPVFIINLVAGKTREGKVLQTLLDKLERIRSELGSDKVFDVIGRVLEGVSLHDYMQQLLERDDETAAHDIDARLTPESVRALGVHEHELYGPVGDVASRLPAERAKLEHEHLRRLLPGDVRRFLERASTRLGLRIEGDADGVFSLTSDSPASMEALWGAFELYPQELYARLSVTRSDPDGSTIFLRPGEPVFEAFRALALVRFAHDARRGGLFVDPYADRPYFFHLARVTIERGVDPMIRDFREADVIESRLIGIRVEEGGTIAEAPVEALLLLQSGSGIPLGQALFAARAPRGRDAAEAYLRDAVAVAMANARREALLTELPARVEFLDRGFDHRQAELAAARSRVAEKARAGDARSRDRLDSIRTRQRALAADRDAALARVRREPELIGVGELTFIAHALVVPSGDPEERRRHDADVERHAVRIARAYEQQRQRIVTDVSTPALAREAGLGDHPGFDLVSVAPDGSKRLIEVKGRAARGAIEVTENEWARACTARDQYWMYAVFDCASPGPLLRRVQDPFGSLLAKQKGSVLVAATDVFANAAREE